MRKTFHLTAIALLLAMTAVPVSAKRLYTPEKGSWRAKFEVLAEKEKKVREAMFTAPFSFWATVRDNGTRRDGFAGYLCMLASDAGWQQGKQGQDFIIHVWDLAAMSQGKLKELGKFHCK